MAVLDGPESGQRVVHLHIFKNAGTSVDRFFFDLLGARRCLEVEDPDHQRFTFSEDDLRQEISRNPDILYFTSHKFFLPQDLKGLLPIILLRHPLIRVLSCFHFEKNIQRVLPEGETLQTYVERRLKQRRFNAIVGRQLATVAGANMQGNWTKSSLNEANLAYAKARVAACSTIGTIDHLETIIQTILEQAALEDRSATKQAFPRENAHLGLSSVDEAQQTLRARLSAETYADLVQQLAFEVDLFDFASNQP
ncbi:MAG: sulfotransferase family 2 domain-containing protein [Pseudomonadota bacterium]